MSDYILDMPDNATISSDTVVDDFIYRGGKITILPTASFIVAGDFIFAPTSSDDPIGTLYGCYAARMAVDSGRNGSLAGFKFYDLYDSTRPLFTPCVIFERSDEDFDVETYFFGGDYMLMAGFLCDLVFKDNKYVTIDALRVGQKELAEFYLHDIRKKFESIMYDSTVIDVGEVMVDGAVEEPKTPNQTLYGFSMNVTLEYEPRYTD